MKTHRTIMLLLGILPWLLVTPSAGVHTAGATTDPPTIRLNPAERAWLDAGHIVRARLGNAPPLHFAAGDSGGQSRLPQGIAVEYLNWISRHVGFKVEYLSGIPWPDALNFIKSHQSIDLLLTIHRSPERESFIQFTDDYLFMPWVIISRNDSAFIGSMGDLAGKTIAAEKGFFITTKLQRDWPQITLLQVDSSILALQAVATGRAEAYIGNLVISTYLIQQQGLTNLKVAAPTPYGNHDQAMGIRSDWPELAGIINKVLTGMTAEQHTAIRNKWLSVRYEHGVRRIDILKWVLVVAGIALLFLGFFWIWNRRLKREVAKRHGVETSLRQNEQRLNAFLRHSPVGVAIFDTQFRYIFINDLLQKTNGPSREAHLGRKFEEVLPEAAPRIVPLLETVLKTAEPLLDVEISGKSSDTSDLPEHHLVSFFPIMDADHTPEYIGATVVDLSLRKLTEKALQESEIRFREVFDHIGSGVAIYDSLDEGESFIFTDLNRFGLTTGHKQKADIIGRDACEVFPGLEDLGLIDVFRRVWRTGRAEKHPSSLYQDDIITLWVENYVFKLPSGELVSVYEDTTAQKQAEASKEKLERHLLQTQKMEAIGNLAGGIAHDFNNILASIIGYTELVLDDVENDSPLEDNLQEIYTAGIRAKDLVRRILTFARKTEVELKPICVAPIADEALKLIRPTLPVTIDIRKEIDCDGLILGNATQLNQIFMNLCTNAAQAMENDGGILDVRITEVELRPNMPENHVGLEPGRYVLITISDTGAGISPEMLDSIFEPYFTTKGIGDGTGMGLAMVHGIVEGYGGKINVTSQLGHGSTFSIYLPATHKMIAGRPREAIDLPTGGEHILFVDDELPITKMGRQILERLGYRVTVQSDSQAALAFFRTDPRAVDLVITDMTMPQMTGDRLATEMIALRPDIPIILCTGYSSRISKERAAEIGIKAFAYKPVTRADLAHTVRRVLDETIPAM